MDFQTLNRRELQALCKLNKIPANITNIAMVDALKSLQTVEGIEEFLNPSRTETVGLSIESPERIEITSPRVPRTSSRTCTRKKAKIELDEGLKTPLVSCTRKKDLETSFHDVANQPKECEDIAKNESLVNHENNCIPNTPVVDVTYSQMKVTKSAHKETVKKETTTTTVQRAYSTRRSTRLIAKTSQGAGVTSEVDLGRSLQERHDVIVLDERDEDSKIEKDVHVDTTFESGKEKVDCCEEMDSLKVKLVEVFEQLEEKSGQVDNLKSSLEGICNPIEPSKLDNHNVVEVMNAECIEENISGNTVDFVNPKKQKVSMSFEGEDGEPQESLIEVEEFLNPSRSETAELSIESPERIEVTRKKAKIVADVEVLKTPLVSCTRKKPLSPSSCHDVASQLIECEDIAKKESLVTKSTPQDTVSKENVKIDSFLDEEKHDDVVLDESDENSKIEKIVDVSGEENLKVKSVEIFEQLENVTFVMNEVDNLKPDSEVDFVSMDFEAQGSLMEEIGVEIRHESSVAHVSLVEDEENHQFSTNAKDDDVIGMTEVSDNIIEENEKEVVVDMNVDVKAKAKSVFDKNSLRQLKKKLKATLLNCPPPTSIRIKTEDSDNKDINKPHVVVVEENEKEDAKSLNNNNNNTRSLRQLKKQLKAIPVKYNNID